MWRSALFIAGAWLVTKASGYFSRAHTRPALDAADIEPTGAASPRQFELERFLRRHGATIGLVALLAAVAAGFFLPDDGCWIDWDGVANPVVCD